MFFFFFSSRRRHTRLTCDWSSDVCSSDLVFGDVAGAEVVRPATFRRLDEAGRRHYLERLLAWTSGGRSEERRVGKECRSRGLRYDKKKRVRGMSASNWVVGDMD